VIETIDGFLGYFDAVHRRAMRDVAALPPEADGWAPPADGWAPPADSWAPPADGWVPPAGAGEGAWSINTLVGHMAGSRLYFASAYRGEGWISPSPPDVSTRDRWLPALDESARLLRERLSGTPDAWLQRKVPMIDTDGALSGWRVLMMMVEHDIHHRSQIDTYAGLNAGLNGWPVPDIYARSAETIISLQDGERAKHAHEAPGR
jgi:hypothetical protein